MGSGEFQSDPAGAAEAGLRRCDKIVQAEAPSRPIARGRAGPGLLAHVLVSKYCDHLPLYRQEEIYEREGVELDRATLADWVGSASGLLQPLVEALRHHVLSATKLHADDTPVPVLAPGLGKTKLAGCGPTCAMIGLPEIRHLQRCGSPTRRTARRASEGTLEQLQGTCNAMLRGLRPLC